MSWITDRIREVAGQAHRSKSGEEETQMHDLRALIEAKKILDADDDDTSAGSRPARGLRFTKLIPPGGGGD